MSMAKDAADRLLGRGELSQSEYNLLESRGLLKEGAIDWAKLRPSRLNAGIRSFAKNLYCPLGQLLLPE